ncbi:hypothetical protein [Poriferisphaera corsica]|uniref:hypothetical protein n=1 Tax=Poriferisphaera corsica TaxID=2528020 RepID=UPI00190DEC02|nr:hypothetical protein [Poriferisphaera corsica]
MESKQCLWLLGSYCVPKSWLVFTLARRPELINGDEPTWLPDLPVVRICPKAGSWKSHQKDEDLGTHRQQI